MIHFVTASKDATVYTLYKTKNTGLDEILTVSKHYSRFAEKDDARVFIQFDTTNIPSYVTASSATMCLKLTEAEEMPVSFSLYSYPVTESNWNMGIGTFHYTPSTNDGISWNTQPGFNTSSVSGSQIFTYQSLDVEMNIKNIYDYWTSSANYGLVLKHSISVESSSLDYGIMNFYSRETNTINQPLLKLGWDDTSGSFSTGSLNALTASVITVKSKELKPAYYEGGKVKVRVIGREQYPTKTFSNSFSYLDVNYLPTSSYYAIRDEITKKKIIDFSTYSKINCNSSGNYLVFDTTNFPKNRVYRLLFLIERDGFEEYFEDDLTFEIRSNGVRVD
jgi:hypothetical protein